jgi:hypothetical protein
MASCDVLYLDPTRARRDPAGHSLGSRTDGWRSCTSPGQVWIDPDLVLRWICPRHRRQLVAQHAAGMADQVRWQRPGLSTHPAQAREATP